MGSPTTPQEAAPAYDDLFNGHPVNRNLSAGTSSGYAAVPQLDTEDVELQAHVHNHDTATPGPSASTPTITESLRQAVARTLDTGPHVHCETCDALTEARQRRKDQQECCFAVAATFIIIAICTMIFGIFVTNAVVKRHGKA